MTDLARIAKRLEDQIATASPVARRNLQPKLGHVLEQLQKNGVAVPRRLSRLNNDLIDEAVEAQFDNMPV